ncbi:MAG: FAD-dependent thymidylate synthase [Deltaproteobacteria bacterium]|jgi:thymidylate synthase (FAD)|nr:FAD-dependent thymidylate synthase [Deltaproteobacteria bacterium]
MPVRLYEPIDRETVIRKIEAAGRVCYRSEPSPDLEGAAAFVKRLVDKGHESVLEHVSVTMIIDCSRACSHQLVRHRLASFSQESQRYTKYADEDSLDFRMPELTNMDDPHHYWRCQFNSVYVRAHRVYLEAVNRGIKPQMARLVLPNAAMTKLFTTMNLRQWRHVIALRTSEAADDEIRELCLEIRAIFRRSLPEVFGD